MQWLTLMVESQPGQAASQWQASPLVIWTVDIGLVVLAVSVALCLYRLIRGPHLSDRALSVDTLGIQLIGIVLLLSVRVGTMAYFDGILVLSLLGFAGTVAMAQYIGRPHRARKTEHPEEEASE